MFNARVTFEDGTKHSLIPVRSTLKEIRKVAKECCRGLYVETVTIYHGHRFVDCYVVG